VAEDTLFILLCAPRPNLLAASRPSAAVPWVAYVQRPPGDLSSYGRYLVFMLIGDKGKRSAAGSASRAEKQIFTCAPPSRHPCVASVRRGVLLSCALVRICRYIKTKLLLSCLVGGAHGIILALIGSNLWLIFAILTFSLNLVPNVGMFIAVTLPMPLVALDPRFTVFETVFAFLGPACVGVVSKDVLEPLFIGQGASLQPVALMLTIMVWGSMWGLTGMVLAVPITAVLKIYMEHIDHPLTDFVVSILNYDAPDESATFVEKAQQKLAASRASMPARAAVGPLI
jgi:hypothetical protein